MAIHFRSEHHDFDQLTIRQKAIRVVTYLRAHDLTGIESDEAYRDLQNCYIGVALQDSKHSSLPLISAAIFCGLAGKLGLDARCCGIPNHVHAMVFPSPLETLDGQPVVGTSDDRSPMYLDPYRSDSEVPVSHLKSMLSAWGVRRDDFQRYVCDTSLADLVLRTSKNILATVHEFRIRGASILETNDHPTIRLYGNPYSDLESSFYAALWANFILGRPDVTSDHSNQRQFVSLVLERFEQSYPMDASLIEQYISPLYSNVADGEHWALNEALRVVRAADQTPRQIKLRESEEVKERVKFQVGQVFRHKRYAYTGIVTGWDIECGMNSEWIEHNQVDNLSAGRHQTFYHAL